MTDQTPQPLTDGKFFLLLDCENCDAEIFYGPCLTLIRHDGAPVVSVSMVEQMSVTCGECGATHYTGELDIMTEDGDTDD